MGNDNDAKRAAEIRDDRLFTQPDESHLDECPICCLPMPLGPNKAITITSSCCSNTICIGCSYANKKREYQMGMHPRCAYCREPIPTTEEEVRANLMKRIKVNDPVAMSHMGIMRYYDRDYDGAFEYLTKAAQLGRMNAHYKLSFMYFKGRGVETDMKKLVYHLEEAAIGGHPNARHNLGLYESDNGREERAMKHFIIAAKLGFDKSLEEVKEGFARGLVSKEDYEAALCGHQAVVDATKSQQRDEAYAFNDDDNVSSSLNEGRVHDETDSIDPSYDPFFVTFVVISIIAAAASSAFFMAR
jgi:tetratricopeptide (TPR) repeat protein